MTRRDWLRLTGSIAAAGTGLWHGAVAQPLGNVDDRVEFRRLVAANRILARENVVDAYGHVSVRHPAQERRYVMSWARSPELVEADDLMLFELDGRTVGTSDRRPYGERMIHGAVYEARPDVHAVVHNHAYALLPFGITGTALRPLIHVASVIGESIPVWDIRDQFGETDMLVRTMEQGRDLASALGDNTSLLMRGHGAVVAGRTIQEAVIAAVYLQINAQVQLQAQALGDAQGLSSEEIRLSRETQLSPLGLERAWEYFCARAGVEAE